MPSSVKLATTDAPVWPALFVSHGTVHEALRSPELRADFAALRQALPAAPPTAVVVVSAHHLTAGGLAVGTAPRYAPLDKGFGPDYDFAYAPPGAPAVAAAVGQALTAAGVPWVADPGGGLDHGALIPLALLFPEARVPVMPLSLRRDLDPAFHLRAARALAPLRQSHGVLVLASGGAVHNRRAIVPLSGHALPPDDWAAGFDAFVANLLAQAPPGQAAETLIREAYAHPDFARAHPTAEHFLPLVFAAGLGERGTQVYRGFQWRNLSLSAYRFD